MKPHQPRQYIERVNRIYHDKAIKIVADMERVNRIYHDKANKIVADMVIYQKASEIKLTQVPSDHWDLFDQKAGHPGFDQYLKKG